MEIYVYLIIYLNVIVYIYIDTYVFILNVIPFSVFVRGNTCQAYKTVRSISIDLGYKARNQNGDAQQPSH